MGTVPIGTREFWMMASRVDSLEKRLLEEMEHDAIHLAQGQDRRADQGFFDNLRSMAGAVSHLRNNHAANCCSGVLAQIDTLAP